ncbi:MAG: FAD-binding protein, partial [bacterium]|nr:FAD-binding protein [bacterium]
MSLFSGFEKTVRQDEPLAMHTWFQLGGPAEYFAEPETVDDLATLVRRCAENELPVRLLGRGSNLLVADEGVPGLVVLLSSPAFRGISVDGATMTIGGGSRLGRVVTMAAHRGLAGLEGLVAIPGTVGGALHGNAGTQSTDIGQWTTRATVMTATGETLQRDRDDMSFGYRHSSLDELVILDASLQLEEDDPLELA